MWKKYKNDFILLIIVFIVLYFLPINVYLTTDSMSANYNTLIFVINPLTIFCSSAIHSRYGRPLFVFPVIYSILYLPLVFTIYSVSYLYCFFIYLIVGLIGGFLGFWFNDKEDVVKSFKKAIGICAIVFSIFAFLVSILDIIAQCNRAYCNYFYNLTVGNLNTYICIVIMILLSIRCLKKKKKKKKKKDDDK